MIFFFLAMNSTAHNFSLARQKDGTGKNVPVNYICPSFPSLFPAYEMSIERGKKSFLREKEAKDGRTKQLLKFGKVVEVAVRVLVVKKLLWGQLQ